MIWQRFCYSSRPTFLIPLTTRQAKAFWYQQKEKHPMVRRPVREGSSARSFVPSRTSSFTLIHNTYLRADGSLSLTGPILLITTRGSPKPLTLCRLDRYDVWNNAEAK